MHLLRPPVDQRPALWLPQLLPPVPHRFLRDPARLLPERQPLDRHGLAVTSLGQIKQNIAKKRKLVVGADSVGFVQALLLNSLFDSGTIQEVFADDEELNEMIASAMSKYLGVDAELDREVRNRLKNLREGTVEWEDEYNRVIAQMRTSPA